MTESIEDRMNSYMNNFSTIIQNNPPTTGKVHLYFGNNLFRSFNTYEESTAFKNSDTYKNLYFTEFIYDTSLLNIFKSNHDDQPNESDSNDKLESNEADSNDKPESNEN